MTEVIAAIWAVLAVMVGLMVPLMLDIRSGNRRLEASLRAEIGSVREEIGSLRDRTGEKFDELRGELAAVKDELRGELAAVKDELRGELAAVKDELGAEIHALAVNQAEMNGQLIVLREFATSRQAA